MSIDGYRIRRVDGNADRDHDLVNCHDVRHTGAECPSCYGVKIACRTHKTTPAGSAKTDDVASSVATGDGTPGGEVEERSPALPSRPAVDPADTRTPHERAMDDAWIAIRPTPADRVTYGAPFSVDRTITADSIHLVTFALTQDAGRQLVRDTMTRHMADLLILRRLKDLARAARRSRFDKQAADLERDALDVELRIASAMTAFMTTQWELTLTQAEGLLEELEEAATDPELCAVGTCTGYATVDGYCGPHADGI